MSDTTAQQCLDAIREAAKEVDGPLTKTDYRRISDGPGHWTINDRFGSWNEAKEQAGVELRDWMYPNGRNTTPSLSRKRRKIFNFSFDG